MGWQGDLSNAEAFRWPGLKATGCHRADASFFEYRVA